MNITKEQEALKKIYELIHPDTTPDGNDFSDGEILDMIFDITYKVLYANNDK
jgi:hypothetical protein